MWHFTILTRLQAFVRVSIKDLVPTLDGTAPQLLVLDTTYDPPIPVPLKIGDLNLDGFVDIVPIIATPSPGNRYKMAKTPKILGSISCSKRVAGCGPDGKGRRGWSVLGRANNVLDEFQDARGVVLVDIDEDVGFASLRCPTLIYQRFIYRGPWILWCSALENRVKGTFFSSRITFTTTPFSSKPLVNPQ